MLNKINGNIGEYLKIENEIVKIESEFSKDKSVSSPFLKLDVTTKKTILPKYIIEDISVAVDLLDINQRVIDDSMIFKLKKGSRSISDLHSILREGVNMNQTYVNLDAERKLSSKSTKDDSYDINSFKEFVGTHARFVRISGHIKIREKPFT